MKENKLNLRWVSTSDYNYCSVVEIIENILRENSPPPLEYYRCEKCRTLFVEGRKNLCKRCYIRKYGEWRNNEQRETN